MGGGSSNGSASIDINNLYLFIEKGLFIGKV
jgi:hypothetical protein